VCKHLPLHAVRHTAGVLICISFAFRVLLGSPSAASCLTDGDERDEYDQLDDDADRGPDGGQAICASSHRQQPLPD